MQCAEGKQETSLGAINSMDSHLQDVEEAASGNEHGKERDPALECGRHQVNPVEGQKTQLKSSGAGGKRAGPTVIVVWITQTLNQKIRGQPPLKNWESQPPVWIVSPAGVFELISKA